MTGSIVSFSTELTLFLSVSAFVWANEQTAVRGSFFSLFALHVRAAHLPVSLRVRLAFEDKNLSSARAHAPANPRVPRDFFKGTTKIKAHFRSSSVSDAMRSDELLWWFVVNQHPVFVTEEFLPPQAD